MPLVRARTRQAAPLDASLTIFSVFKRKLKKNLFAPVSFKLPNKTLVSLKIFSSAAERRVRIRGGGNLGAKQSQNRERESEIRSRRGDYKFQFALTLVLLFDCFAFLLPVDNCIILYPYLKLRALYR